MMTTIAANNIANNVGAAAAQAKSTAPTVQTSRSLVDVVALEGSSARAYEADVLVQLKANLSQLDDLHGRLKHLMGELNYLLRKS